MHCPNCGFANPEGMNFCNFSITPGKGVQKTVQGGRGEVGWRG